MAATKLTLSVKEESLPFVKKYAKHQHTSVSKLVQQFFDSLVEKQVKADTKFFKFKTEEELPEFIKDLTISGAPVPDFDHKAEYHKHLEQKYGL
jgi:flagellar hook-basal body complex protein FliE